MSRSGREGSEALKDVRSATSALQDLLNAQSQSTVSDLGALEQLNRDAILRYETMNDAAEGLATDSNFLKDNHDEIEKYAKQVVDLSDKVVSLEALVLEMNEWSKELAVKVKRL